MKVEELVSDLLKARGLTISIGRIFEEEWEEPVGPTPFPEITDLRSWDMRLLKRYRPFYLPWCELCCLCTFGKCDLSKGKRGACGLDLRAQLSRMVLIACCIGASTHTHHARHLLEHLIEKFGRRHHACP